MTANIEHEWIAVAEDGSIEQRKDTESGLRKSLELEGINPDDYELMAVPKPHYSVWV